MICVPAGAGARRGAVRAPPRRARALRHLRRLRRRRRRRDARARTSCSRPFARTARGSSARTASASPSRGPHLNATFAPRALPPGRIGFSSQSGALGLALLEKAASRGLGFSSFISIGNKADVSSNDLLEWWEDDPDTDVVLLYLESFGNPRRFARVARRVARRKPILALKAGTSGAGARAAGSHTAALAGSDAAADALFAQAGVLRARTLEELIDTAVVLGSQPLPHGRQVAVITNAGGLGILCADACAAAGLSLPDALRADARRARAGAAARGEHRKPGRPPRLGHRRHVRGRGAARPRRPERRRADRPVRPAGRRRRGGSRRRDQTSRRGHGADEAGARGRDERRRHARAPARRDLAGRGARVSGVGRAGARSARRSRRMAAPARRCRARARRRRHRRRAAGSSRPRWRMSSDGWLPPEQARVLLEAYGVPLVPELVATRRGRRRRGGAHARLPGRREVGRSRARTRPSAAASHSTYATSTPCATP